MVHRPALSVAAALALLLLGVLSAGPASLADPGAPRAAHQSSDSNWRTALADQLQPGDVVFRRGTGPEAEVVAGASIGTSGESRWTHVGIVASGPAGGLRVIHADSSRGVVADEPGRFFSVSEARSGDFLRVAGGSSAAQAAESYLGLPFDAEFSLKDKRALYCTELVLAAFEDAGTGVRPALRKLPLSEPMAFPDDLATALQRAVVPRVSGPRVSSFSAPA